MTDSSNFFHLNVLLFKFSGLWVPRKFEKSYKYRIICWAYDTLCVSYSMIFFTISQIVVLSYSYNNRETLIKNLNMASSYIVSTFKVFSWFYWRKEILKIMDTLQNTLAIFEKFDDFDPEALIAKRKTVKDYLIKLYQSMSATISLSCMVSKLIEVTFSGSKYQVFNNETGYRYEQELPYQSWVPVDPQSSKGSHLVAVFMQVIGLFNGGAITVGVDMLYVALIVCTTVHFELLQGAFRTVRQKCARNLKIKGQHILDPPELLKATDKEMKKYIMHFEKILEICESLENIYSYLILAQLLISVIALCTCLFLVSSIPVGTQLLGSDLAYLLCVENQLALYCYTANELTISAAGIPQSLYEGDWLSTSKIHRDRIKFTMLRMSKPIYLTIGKFMPLTLDTFVAIGRASYSLLAILKR